MSALTSSSAGCSVASGAAVAAQTEAAAPAAVGGEFLWTPSCMDSRHFSCKEPSTEHDENATFKAILGTRHRGVYRCMTIDASLGVRRWCSADACTGSCFFHTACGGFLEGKGSAQGSVFTAYKSPDAGQESWLLILVCPTCKAALHHACGHTRAFLFPKENGFICNFEMQ